MAAPTARSANLAVGEIAQPDLFKIFATNPSNAKFVLDQFITAENLYGYAQIQAFRVARQSQGLQQRLLRTKITTDGSTSPSPTWSTSAKAAPAPVARARPGCAPKPAGVSWLPM